MRRPATVATAEEPLAPDCANEAQTATRNRDDMTMTATMERFFTGVLSFGA
jgi:hypothetical protein